ncbi:adenylosuccinate lyase [Candidatus Uhrbacteria bacterium]|nr:adenylosuccinate lyase [Candidatus Uhrbacteria bacterium]
MDFPPSAADCISPLDYRFWDPEIAKHLSPRAFLRRQIQTEVALVRAQAARGLCPDKAVSEVTAAAGQITWEEVMIEEDRISHDIQARVNCLRAKVSDETKPFIHRFATSYDIIDTANALLYREAAQDLVYQRLVVLVHTLLDVAEREAATAQIGRTHGQHALPITFGLALAVHASRLNECALNVFENAPKLRGKFSGAVGAYNAASKQLEDPEAFEKEFLALLHLKPAEAGTQIAPPEPLTTLVSSIVEACGVMANIADDMRHLCRSEIGEVSESFAKNQVGSSAMPHKRNPITFENVKSLWYVVKERHGTVLSTMISEHQRDLTNSAAGRFLPEIFAIAAIMAKRLNKAMAGLVVHREAMARNLDTARTSIAAESVYTALAAKGHPNAHEKARQLAVKSREIGQPLMNLILEDEEASKYLADTPIEQLTPTPGIAEHKARSIIAVLRNRYVW